MARGALHVHVLRQAENSRLACLFLQGNEHPRHGPATSITCTTPLVLDPTLSRCLHHRYLRWRTVYEPWSCPDSRQPLAYPPLDFVSILEFVVSHSPAGATFYTESQHRPLYASNADPRLFPTKERYTLLSAGVLIRSPRRIHWPSHGRLFFSYAALVLSVRLQLKKPR